MTRKSKTKDELLAEIAELRKTVEEMTGLTYESHTGEILEYDSDNEWQVMMNMLGDFIFVVDSSGNIIRANPVVSRILGYTNDDLMRMNMFDLYPPEMKVEAEETYSRIIMGEKFLCDIPFMTRDGNRIDVETKVTSGRWRNQEVIFSISRDVSAGKAVQYEIRLAFEKLKTILDSVSAYIWSAIIDSNGNFSYMYQSPAVEAITGRPATYFQTGLDQWFQIIIQEDTDLIKSIYQALISGDSAREEVGYKITHIDGTVRWVRDSILARKFGEGQIRLDGVITDVTERRMAVEALKNSESTLRGILSSMADMVFAFDRDTCFTFFHTPEVKNLYIEPEKFIGKRFCDVMPSHVIELFRAAFEKTQRHEEAEFLYWLTIDNKKKWYSAKLAPIIGDNKFNGAVAVVRDITTRKALEDNLRVSEHKYHELFNIIRDGYTMVDMEGMIIESNRAFRELIGYTVDEIYSLRYQDITPEKWHDIEKKILEEQVLSRGYSDVYKKEYLRKDGTIVPVEVRTYVQCDGEGNPQGMWAIVRESNSIGSG